MDFSCFGYHPDVESRLTSQGKWVLAFNRELLLHSVSEPPIAADRYNLLAALCFKVDFVRCSGESMFEVYLNNRHDLLVIERGAQLPLSSASGKWRKRKKPVRVSAAIRSAVQREGYYLRKLSRANRRGARS